jgi:hypothetical protein
MKVTSTTASRALPVVANHSPRAPCLRQSAGRQGRCRSRRLTPSSPTFPERESSAEAEQDIAFRSVRTPSRSAASRLQATHELGEQPAGHRRRYGCSGLTRATASPSPRAATRRLPHGHPGRHRRARDRVQRLRLGRRTLTVIPHNQRPRGHPDQGLRCPRSRQGTVTRLPMPLCHRCVGSDSWFRPGR